MIQGFVGTTMGRSTKLKTYIRCLCCICDPNRQTVAAAPLLHTQEEVRVVKAYGNKILNKVDR